jgi:hypothetical protein
MSQTILALPLLLNASPAPAVEPTAPLPRERERLRPGVRGRIQTVLLGMPGAHRVTAPRADSARPCRS